jgi:magnesium and cobalt transporter
MNTKNTLPKPPPSPMDGSENIPGEDDARLGMWESFRSWLTRLLVFRQDGSLKDALEEIIEEHEEQSEEPLPLEEKRMLHNVLSFGDIKVSDIMTPRTDITAVPSDITLPQLKTHILRHRHTRVPIYKDTFDQMLGFVHVKDLLPMFSGDIGFEIEALMHDLLFVPPSMRILDLLVKMRKSGIHMAIVVDEHGGTDGLVTLEDLFEEIVGDISDEHDSKDEEQTILTAGDRMFDVSARCRIETLEQQLGLNLVTEEKDDEFDTLGGLIFFQLGRVPARGEIIPHVSGIKFEIVDADPRRIHKIRIHTH